MKNIFVGNLSFQITETDLRTAFERYGEVLNGRMVTDRETCRARGITFVEMADAEQSDRAISEMNGSSLDGRPLTVNEAHPKGERSFCGKGPGGFGQSEKNPRRGRESRR